MTAEELKAMDAAAAKAKAGPKFKPAANSKAVARPQTAPAQQPAVLASSADASSPPDVDVATALGVARTAADAEIGMEELGAPV